MNYTVLELVVSFILVVFAGYLATAEMAIASFGTQKIEELEERGDKLAPYYTSIQNISDTFFGTIQVTTIIALTLASILAFIAWNDIVYYFNIFPGYQTLTAIVFTTLYIVPLTVILSILVPKSIGFKYSEIIGNFSVRILLFFTRFYKYPIKAINYFSNLILLPFDERTNFTQTRFSEDEIRIIISEGVKSGALGETEQEIIENVFEFNDLRANEVMIPRTEMMAIDADEDPEENKKTIMECSFTQIPVYQESRDNIIGILHIKEYLKALIDNTFIDVKSLVRPAYFIPEAKLISEVLREMQNSGERMAIVMDEYGGTEGFITMEDLIKEIVGEMHDNGIEESEYRKVGEGIFLVDGSMFIDDFNNKFNKDLPASDEYNTIAGFIGEQTGRILDEGEEHVWEELHFQLIEKERQKMSMFKVWSSSGTFNVAEH